MGAGGRSTEIDGTAELRNDPLFAPFFDDNFSVSEFASSALSTPGIDAKAQIEKIKEGIAALDNLVRAEVTKRQQELLRQAGQLREAETYLHTVNVSLDGIQQSMARVRSDTAEPYNNIRSRTQQLGSLLNTTNLLRHIINALKLMQKLRTQMASDSGGLLDLAKAAKLISDIEAVSQEVDLTGIAVIDAELQYLKEAESSVRQEAKNTLLAGIDSLNQAEVGSALQVFFNLHELKQEVHHVLQSYIEQVEETFSSALDAKKLTSGVGAAAAGGNSRTNSGVPTSKFPDNLWQSLSKAFSQLHKVVVAVWHLQRVLAKKRDPLTHVLFLDEVVAPGHPLPLDFLWSRVIHILGSSLDGGSAHARGGVIKEVLSSNYPRLAGMMDELWDNIQRDTEVRGSPPALNEEHEEMLQATAAPFQQSYLAASLTRMSDGVMTAFPGGTRALQSAAELQKCIARLHEELKVVSVSNRLCVMTAATVGKALQLMAEKAEYMAATGPDVRAVNMGCTSSQLRNISICNSLQEVHRSMVQLLSRLQPDAGAILRQPLDALQSAGCAVVTPMFRGMVEAAEDTLMRMHADDFGADSPTTDPPTMSKYMAELRHQLTSWRSDYLAKFNPMPSPQSSTIASALVQRMACRLMVFFVRHAALLRPLSAAGRLRVAKDAVELETSIGTQLFPLEHLGAPFRMLRAFRPLLFVDTPSLKTSPLLQELPMSVVLHHLYSRAPAGLLSPIARMGVTAAQYSVWLDEHTVKDAVKGIKAALTACEDKARGQEGFDEIFPLMMTLCSALEEP